jgi:hypothetical protein
MTDNLANDALAAAPDISALSQEQASSLLGQMVKSYQDAQPPDPWRASPDAAAKQLAEIAKAAPPPSESAPGLSPYKTLSFVEAMHEAGMEPRSIEENLAGKNYGADDIAFVRAEKARVESDPEWVRRFLAGGLAERKFMTRAIDIISRPDVEQK